VKEEEDDFKSSSDELEREEVECNNVKIEEADGPGKFYIGDNKYVFKEEESDGFSPDSSMSKASSVDYGAGLFKYAAKMNGDEALPTESSPS
jgi:hypothetical protein